MSCQSSNQIQRARQDRRGVIYPPGYFDSEQIVARRNQQEAALAKWRADHPDMPQFDLVSTVSKIVTVKNTCSATFPFYA